MEYFWAFVSYFVLTNWIMKGTAVPNPRRSSACDCSCVLSRIDHDSLLKGFRLSHACHAHSVLFLPMHSLLKGFRLSHACHAHSVLFLPMHSLLKGFRLSHACHAHSVLFLPMQSLLTGFWRSFTGLVQLIFSFPSWFHSIWFYCSHTFHNFLSQITLRFSFGSKDMITAFTCLSFYRYSSFTLRAYLCWRHT